MSGQASGKIDEFQILRDEARARGLLDRLPPVSRLRRPAPGGAVSLLRWGEAPARALLLHGAALNAHTWDVALLAWGAPSIAVDLPGHGDSAWREDADYAPATLARALEPAARGLLAEGSLAPGFALIGQSLGGLAALDLADRLPQAGRLVLVDVLPLPATAQAAVQSFLAGPALFDSREQIVRRALAFGLGGREDSLRRAVALNTRVRADGRVEWKHHLGRLGPAALRLGDEAAQWRQLAALDRPLDLVAATRGLAAPELIARLRRLRPDARVARIDAGHNVQEDAPVELGRILAQLTGVGGA